MIYLIFKAENQKLFESLQLFKKENSVYSENLENYKIDFTTLNKVKFSLCFTMKSIILCWFQLSKHFYIIRNLFVSES